MSTKIRMVAANDAAPIAAIYAPFCATDCVVSFETRAPAPDEMAGRIAMTTVAYPWLVAEDASGIRGYVYASRHRERAAYRWSADVTAYLRADSRGQGLGTALYGVLFEFLRAQGFFKAYAGIALPNPGSVGLHEALGFRPVGIYREVGFKHGAWRDVGWWQLALQPKPAAPEPPLSMAGMVAHPLWSAALGTAPAQTSTDTST